MVIMRGMVRRVGESAAGFLMRRRVGREDRIGDQVLKVTLDGCERGEKEQVRGLDELELFVGGSGLTDCTKQPKSWPTSHCSNADRMKPS